MYNRVAKKLLHEQDISSTFFNSFPIHIILILILQQQLNYHSQVKWSPYKCCSVGVCFLFHNCLFEMYIMYNRVAKKFLHEQDISWTFFNSFQIHIILNLILQQQLKYYSQVKWIPYKCGLLRVFLQYHNCLFKM